MTNWIRIKNNSKIKTSNIPTLNITELRNAIIEERKRPIAFFGQTLKDKIKLYVALADDTNAEILISSAIFNSKSEKYECITNESPAFHMFEREFYEEFGIEPVNHPWLKPVRNNQQNYNFFEMKGEEVHQVAVGPIHAGVIEPGHFRFMCNGENVYHLEIMLGYQHRGIEKLMLKKHSNQLAESICGDSVIAYNTTYSNIIELLKNIEITNKAQLIRKIALEMERVAIHIGDLGALSGDIAYLMGASVFGATRTLVINTMLGFSGSRFGRGLIKVGGVNFDLPKEKIEQAKKTFKKVEKNVVRMCETMLKNTSVMSRLEKTGTVSTERAKEIGLVGMAARACGVDIDSRFDFPDKWIKKLKFERNTKLGIGDVNSRFKLRYKEIKESFKIIRQLLLELENYQEEPICAPTNTETAKDTLAISIVEGWRGEIIHIAITDENGNLSRYKIKDPSFNNWFGLALAVRNNGISDFPLCNKSFNLSYAGNDL